MKKIFIFVIFLVSVNSTFSQNYNRFMYKNEACNNTETCNDILNYYSSLDNSSISIGLYSPFVPEALIHFKHQNLNRPLFLLESEWVNENQNISSAQISFYKYLETKYFGIYQSGLPITNGYNFFQNTVLIGDNVTAGTELLNVHGKVSIGKNLPGGTELLNVNGKARINDGLYVGKLNAIGEFDNAASIHGAYVLDFYCPPDPHQKSNADARTDDRVLSLANCGVPKTATIRGRTITESFRLTENCGLHKILVSDPMGNGIWTEPSTLFDNYWKINNEKELYSPRRVGLHFTYQPLDTDPISDFQVNNGFISTSIGSAHRCFPGEHEGTSYIGFNAARDSIFDWYLSSNGTYNGGSIIMGDVGGNLNIFTIPSGNEPAIQDISEFKTMTINSNGKVEILSSSLIPLEVSGGEDSYIRSHGVNNAGLWAYTNAGGTIGIYTDRDQIGHITLSTSNTDYINLKAGKVLIGSNDFSHINETCRHNLFVTGGVTTEEVIVKIPDNWPDFVFDNEYELLDIKNLEYYIDSHRHLPGIPNANQLKIEGDNLAKMDAALLQKIEELTLYIIELQKEIDLLKEKINK